MDAAVSFDPLSELLQEKDCDTLLLHLPGFTKEQLKVQLTRSRVLKISGLRPIGDDKWSRFQKDFPIPENIDSNKITARFEDGVLHVKLPKLVVPASEKDEQKTAQEHQLTAPNADDHSKQAGTEKLKEEKMSELEGGRKDEAAKICGGVVVAETNRPEQISGSNVDKVDILKMAREKMVRVLMLLFAFVLGMYVSRLRCSSPEFQSSEMKQ